MKVAFKLGYLGRGYHGFQHQPAVPTVQAAVRDALRSLGINDGSFCYAEGPTGGYRPSAR